VKTIRDFISLSPLVTDGAAGTYLSSVAGRNTISCELLNITDPDLVFQMHRQYAAAGAKLILTNTFNAADAERVSGIYSSAEIIRSGIRLARQAAGKGAFVCGDIGLLPDEYFDITGYLKEADAFIAEGISIFMCETFPDSEIPIAIARHIRNRIPDAFIIASFAVMPDGLSRSGKKGQTLIDEISRSGLFDSAGFNCCSGPSHLLSYASSVNFGNLIPVIRPNAGYPRRENGLLSENKISYPGTPEYFASALSAAPESGFKIIGGCCGTTPAHIALLSKALSSGVRKDFQLHTPDVKPIKHVLSAVNGFENALLNNTETIIIAEIEPPFTSDMSSIDAAASALKDAGVHAITVADSPMSRARADSVMCASRLKRKYNIEAIPHLCCRDKNINAIRSALLAAHAEGIRNILAITGDPVPESDRSLVKSVFNLSSVKLCRYIRSMNEDVFSGDPLFYGCAFNANSVNMNAETDHLKRKIDAGAEFILTQPVFSEPSIEAVINARTLGIKTLAGIFIPVSFKNVMFLANEMPGFDIPEQIISKFSPEMSREEGEDTGIAIASDIIKRLSGSVDGCYLITPFNRVSITQRVIRRMMNSGNMF
jgi:homocysteine S-methyltransferase